MRRLLEWWFGRRPAMPVLVMTEGEKVAGFGSAPEHPLWKATLAELDEKILEVSDRPLDEKLGDAEIRFHLGGQAALLEFKEALLEREMQAREQKREK